MKTRTGGFPLGFRRGGSEWQRDLGGLISWAQENGFGALDIGDNGPEAIKQIGDAGLRVGSVDALSWAGLINADATKRQAAVAANQEYIRACAGAGAYNFFIVMLPADPAAPRRDNFALMVESLNALAPTLEETESRLVIEGWPGPGALCCTPETVRATFEACPSPSIALNYDPSHLLRMGIDPLRFLREFAGRVGHVHGKDASVKADNIYEYGFEQPATFATAPAFGAYAWRYTIPGAGETNWPEVLSILQENGYQGVVCIELEDANYNGTTEGEQRGLLDGALFLTEC